MYKLYKQLRDGFIPHRGNKYEPNILQKFSVAIMLLLLLISFALANLHSLLWTSSEWLVSTVLPAVIVDLTNEQRGGDNLSSLSRNVLLDEAAKLKAEHMANNGYFAHYSPTGETPWFWFDEVDYSYVYAGENLAIHFTDSSDVVEGWMDSPTHRENIMSNVYTEIGVGTAKGEYGGYNTVFVVQLFGVPATSVAEIQSVTNSITEVNNLSKVENIEVTTVGSATPSVAAAFDDKVAAQEGQIEVEVVPEVFGSKAKDVEEPVLYLDLATDTREGVILSQVENDTGPTSYESGWAEKVATQPSSWLRVVYTALALFVFVTLLLSIFIEWRKQRPVQIAYGIGLMTMMVLLTYVHTLLTDGVFVL